MRPQFVMAHCHVMKNKVTCARGGAPRSSSRAGCGMLPRIWAECGHQTQPAATRRGVPSAPRPAITLPSQLVLRVVRVPCLWSSGRDYIPPFLLLEMLRLSCFRRMTRIRETYKVDLFLISLLSASSDLSSAFGLAAVSRVPFFSFCFSESLRHLEQKSFKFFLLSHSVFS